MKILKCIIILLLFAFLDVSCNRNNQSHTVEINDISQSTVVSIPLNRQYSTHYIQILKNTTNDTFLLGIIAIPPGKTGRIFATDLFNKVPDTLEYKVKPYKASKGSVHFEHGFY